MRSACCGTLHRKEATMKTTTVWTPTLAWIGAASAALMLAMAAPDEVNVMGRLPTLNSKSVDQQPLVLPAQLPAERSLALVAYTKHQRAEVQSWVQGMNLEADSSIPWFRLSVLNDPGSESARSDAEKRLLAKYPHSDHARLLPVFTNREAFARAAGVSGTEHAAVLIVDREGRVLARAEGAYDEAKAQALRETLLAARRD
jgi:hypothetical protein